MSDNIIDITDPAEPITVAREMVNRAVGCKAGVAILVREDGSMWFDCSGQKRMYILWALEKMKAEIIAGNRLE